MEPKQISAVVLVVLLLINLVFFGLGKINGTTFWTGIVIIAIISYFFYKKK